MKETLKRHFESSLDRTAEFELANTALGLALGPFAGATQQRLLIVFVSLFGKSANEDYNCFISIEARVNEKKHGIFSNSNCIFFLICKAAALSI